MSTPFVIHLNQIWMPERNMLGQRPICCTTHQPHQIDRRNEWPLENDDEDDIRCVLYSFHLYLNYLVKFLPHTNVWD